MFRWFTRFNPSWPKLTGERYLHRLISDEGPTQVFENLGWTPSGWFWSRHTMTLHPPESWHDESTGNHADISFDYRLASLGPTRTRLEQLWRVQWKELTTLQQRRAYTMASIRRTGRKEWDLRARACERAWRARETHGRTG
ncbi:MAG: hypothetical protein KGI89_16245 [Euryarchaeota archaeon]|nr:hypothetical protein [Euryarchaeota archaeon]